MEHKYGTFDSAEELNRAAAGWKEKGDLEALTELALENGLDREDAEDYMNGETDALATPFLAAFGRLKTEAEDLELGGILNDWKDIIAGLCEQDGDMQAAVMDHRNSLKECMARLIRFSFENKVQVNDGIVKAVRITSGGKEEPFRSPLYLGVPNRAEVRKIAGDYYLGKQV